MSMLSSITGLIGHHGTPKATATGKPVKIAPLTLTGSFGTVIFTDYAIPEKITYGGEQALAVHDLIGGVRIVDTLGRRDDPLEWSGLLFGPLAMGTATMLNKIRVTGEQVTLSWSSLKYLVVIRSFRPTFERQWQIGYSIKCEVVQDLTGLPSSQVKPASLDAAVKSDAATAGTLAASVNNSGISSAISSVQSAVKSISSFATATKAEIASVVGPVLAAQQQVSTLIATASNTIKQVTTLGGILPNNPLATQISKLTTQVATANQLPQLIALRGVLGRMGGNLGSATTSGQVIATSESLFSLASKAYGDATQWVGIAHASGITDPQATGIKTVTIPPSPPASGGVLSS